MIDGKRVIAWTPYGRRETVEILLKYMIRDYRAGIVDGWWLCLNTDPSQGADLAYAYELASRFPEWIKLVSRPEGRPIRFPKQRNTGYFYEYMTDPDTAYIRLDDDIVYVHEDAVARLARHRLEQPGGVASFPVMWNNAVISWYAQQAGVIPAAGTPCREHGPGTYVWPKVGGPYCMDPVGWADGVFAVNLHRMLIEWIEMGTEDRAFLYQDYQLPIGMQFSVSTFASLGSMYAGLPDGPGVLVPYEEEHWHTVFQPAKLEIPNVIVGDALVSHYTFFPQGPIVRASNVLDRYRALANKL